MRNYLSVSSNLFSFIVDACFFNVDDFNLVTSVDVSFSDGVYNILGSVFDILFVLGQLLYKLIVTNELVIKKWGGHFLS